MIPQGWTWDGALAALRTDPQALIVTLIVGVILLAFVLAWIGEKR